MTFTIQKIQLFMTVIALFQVPYFIYDHDNVNWELWTSHYQETRWERMLAHIWLAGAGPCQMPLAQTLPGQPCMFICHIGTTTLLIFSCSSNVCLPRLKGLICCEVESDLYRHTLASGGFTLCTRATLVQSQLCAVLHCSSGSIVASAAGVELKQNHLSLPL